LSTTKKGRKLKKKKLKTKNKFRKIVENDKSKIPKIDLKNDSNMNKSRAGRTHRFKFSTFVLQKYLEKPLLVNNRKFDIRVWCLVTYEM